MIGLLALLGGCGAEAVDPAVDPDTLAATTPETFTASGTVAGGEWRHYGPFSAAAGELRVVVTGTGDPDLYVRYGAQPTTTSYTCRPYLDGADESCVRTLTGPTQVHVSVRGYAASSTFQLAVTYPREVAGGTTTTVTQKGSVARGAFAHHGPYAAAAGRFEVTMTGTGDADLYVRRGAQPTTTAYDCRPYRADSNESCVLDLAAPAQVHVSVRGYTNASYTLTIRYQAPAPSAVEWPNAQSRASSDPWIAQHHAEIRVMRPRVLALNFVNRRTMDEMRAALGGMIDVIREASRYHGYDDAQAPAFLQYELAYAVDLRDATPPAGWPYNNSTRYPREEPVEGYWGFDYERLFTDEYAGYFGIRDPATGRNLRLAELVERGLVHEVWIYGDADVPDGSAAEVLEVKPRYDEARVRIAGAMDRCAGNGCFDDEDTLPAELQRTLRIAYFNQGRGYGCFLESLGHGWESMGSRGRNLIPYLSRYFEEWAGMDLDRRHGLAFPSWYACPYGQPCLTYPTQSSVRYTLPAGTGTLESYDPVCGNAHFTPAGRQHYDLDSDFAVRTSCKRYRDGSGASDLFSRADYDRYRTVAPDCMGPFLMWWRQSLPGLDNRSRDAAGAPMLNWWPFLFY